MTKIRYADLPEGLHAQASIRRGRTVIYLRPGLTTAQRREALRRAMRTARVGGGPPLPLPGVAVAVAIDHVAGTARAVLAAIRSHPLGSLLLAVAVAGMLTCYALLVSVSNQALPASAQDVPAPLLAAHPMAGPAAWAVPAGPAASRSARAATGPGATGPSAGRSGSPWPGTSGTGASPPSPSSSPSPRPSPTSPGPTPSPSSSSSPTSTPTPTPSPTSSQLCVKVGPVWVCF